jgi:signal peptidase I
MNSLLLIIIIIRLGVTVGYWKVFEKTGIATWAALIPFYSEWQVMKLVGKSPWWAIYLLIPIINIFAFYILIFDLLRCFGKESLASQLITIFAFFVYLPIVAFNKDSKYLGKLVELPVVQKGPLAEWTEAITFAVVAATLIRWTIMEAYTIPTPSMENSLLVGDFLFVSKFHYGTRTPATPLQLPLTHQKIWFTEIPSYLDWVQLPQYRLPGLTKIKNGDVVVFNVPGDYENNWGNDIRSTWIHYPVDLKMNYIKRCVAIPGDTLVIKSSDLFVNGKAQGKPPLMQYSYEVVASDEINERNFAKLGLDPEDHSEGSRSNDNKVYYRIFLTDDKVEELKSLPYIISVKKVVKTEREYNIYPRYDSISWSGDNYGPIVIPAEGMTITINDSTLSFYGTAIRDFEHNKNVVIDKDGLTIDGQKVTQYTFKQDYYFMMGDNRHNSHDSRYWGFVPADHIVGKGFFIWLSIDKYGSWLGKIRWSRFFKPIS